MRISTLKVVSGFLLIISLLSDVSPAQAFNLLPAPMYRAYVPGCSDNAFGVKNHLVSHRNLDLKGLKRVLGKFGIPSEMVMLIDKEAKEELPENCAREKTAKTRTTVAEIEYKEHRFVLRGMFINGEMVYEMWIPIKNPQEALEI